MTGVVDQKFADAFPSTQQLVGQGAGYIFFGGDYFKNNTDIISWKGTGIFKDAAFEEARCMYVTFPGQQIYQCMSCNWYIGQAPLFQ